MSLCIAFSLAIRFFSVSLTDFVGFVVSRENNNVTISWPGLHADFAEATVFVTRIVERIPRDGRDPGPKTVSATAAPGKVTFLVQPGYVYRYDVIIKYNDSVVFRKEGLKLDEHGGEFFNLIDIIRLLLFSFCLYCSSVLF